MVAARALSSATWRFSGQSRSWRRKRQSAPASSSASGTITTCSLGRRAARSRGTFSMDRLKALATPVGLGDQAAFNRCLDTRKYTSRVQLETQRGMKQGINSTPTLFINGQRLRLTAQDPVETIRLAVQKAQRP